MALDLRRQYRSRQIPGPLAGLADIALARGERAKALTYVEEILHHLEANLKIENTHEPFRVHLTCYRVLRANEDPRAEDILNAAHSLLQERAHKIDDEELRRSYLENVAVHREIIAAWKEGSHA